MKKPLGSWFAVSKHDPPQSHQLCFSGGSPKAGLLLTSIFDASLLTSSLSIAHLQNFCFMLSILAVGKSHDSVFY